VNATTEPEPPAAAIGCGRGHNLSRAVHAEWTKLRTVPSTPWLVLAAVTFTVAASAGVHAPVDTSLCP